MTGPGSRSVAAGSSARHWTSELIRKHARSARLPPQRPFVRPAPERREHFGLERVEHRIEPVFQIPHDVVVIVGVAAADPSEQRTHGKELPLRRMKPR